MLEARSSALNTQPASSARCVERARSLAWLRRSCSLDSQKHHSEADLGSASGKEEKGCSLEGVSRPLSHASLDVTDM